MCENNNVNMTEEEFESKLTESYILGISSGYDEASLLIMKEAVKYFERGDDKLSKYLRQLSEDIQKKGEEKYQSIKENS